MTILPDTPILADLTGEIATVVAVYGSKNEPRTVEALFDDGTYCRLYPTEYTYPIPEGSN